MDYYDHLIKKAFKITRRNYGCCGNDGIYIRNIKENFSEFQNDLKNSLYNLKFDFEKSPKESIISDYQGKLRKIYVYNLKERVFQGILKLIIENEVTNLLKDYVYGFRRGKTDIQSYQYILKNNPLYILKVDIKDYFESISKENLYIFINQLNVDFRVLDLVKDAINHKLSGIPQGNVLSPILSNLYLAEFDKYFESNYTRFGDDMLFGIFNHFDIDKTLNNIKLKLENYNLDINTSKIKIIKNPSMNDLIC